MRRILVLILLLGAAAVGATPAMEAFEAGRWGEAVGLGREGSTVDDRIAAARAGSVIASYVTRDKEEARRLLAQAVADAEAAVAIQPESGRARVERALVGGFLAKLERSPGRAKGARADAEAALQKDGNDALAHAVLGGWHLESVATLGSLVGRTLLGARESEGRKRFERAIALDPGSVLYPVFYAFALLSLDPMEAPKAAELLVKADRAKPRDAYERLVQANGRQVLVELQKGEPYRARDLAKRLSPLGKLA